LRDAILRSGKRGGNGRWRSCRWRGLVVHTANEGRDLNNAGEVFENLPEGQDGPKMVALTTHS
jgi:hypothetical protein